MSEKFEKFADALEALCREHQVQIATSGYDCIDIWDLGRVNDEPIYGGRKQLKDQTREQKS